jgi:hypothetical protein
MKKLSSFSEIPLCRSTANPQASSMPVVMPLAQPPKGPHENLPDSLPMCLLRGIKSFLETFYQSAKESGFIKPGLNGKGNFIHHRKQKLRLQGIFWRQ